MHLLHGISIFTCCVTVVILISGAAFANQRKLHSAVKEFQRALELDPTDANATKYLHVTQTKIQEEANHRFESAVNTKIVSHIPTRVTDTHASNPSIVPKPSASQQSQSTQPTSTADANMTTAMRILLEDTQKSRHKHSDVCCK